MFSSFYLKNLQSSSVHPSISHHGKRSLDIIGALVGLVLTAFIAIPIWVIIQWTDRGSLFYSQIRYGLYGKLFKIYKFRTMIANADQLKHLVKNEAQGQFFKNSNDPRITKLGTILRRTSLDEFPQFWNVLRGEMSLVGTRPPTFDEVSQYLPHHWQRLNIKPGLTGEWQVNGRSLIKNFEEVVQLDLQYQQKWSLIYDCQLIIKTIQVVLTRLGAC